MTNSVFLSPKSIAIIGASDKCVLDKILLYKEGLKQKVIKGAEDLKRN